MFVEIALQQMPRKLQQLSHILHAASQLIVEEYDNYQQGTTAFGVGKKFDNSPVTQADIRADRYITAELTQLEPVLPVLSEEGSHEGHERWSQFWLVDPLDGTKEFIHKTGEFTINLSLIDNGQSVISAIAVPLKHTLYIGEKGALPFRWQWDQQGNLSVFQYQHRYQDGSLLHLAMSRRPEDNPLYPQFLQYLTAQYIPYEKVSAGSAYKFCMMLEGEIDMYPRFHPTSEWDTAAGQGLLECIGGGLFSLRFQPFLYNQRKTLLNGSFVAVRDVKDWQYIADFLAQITQPTSS